jgi:hypothetical protein
MNKSENQDFLTGGNRGNRERLATGFRLSSVASVTSCSNPGFLKRKHPLGFVSIAVDDRLRP